ncbi:MAG: hypothetical protein JWR85_747 [Marmoricola sp.]|jgi:hypothetical protein|nr:hypothetical protein [Marmoricola sp.]
MYGSSALLTVGHAIDRAKSAGMTVRMNIGGEWVTGVIVSSDGHGVAMLEPNGELCVARHDSISCIRMPSGAANDDRSEQRTPRPAPAPSRQLDYV